MNHIDLTLSETLNGITVTLSFSIYPEALKPEVLDCPKSSVCCDTLSDLAELILQVAEKEIAVAASTARQKLQIALISASGTYLHDEIHELNKE